MHKEQEGSCIRTLKKLTGRFLDLLYPPSLYCCICGNIIDESRPYSLCDHCREHLMWDGEGIRMHNGLKLLRCTQYGIYERTLIFSLKYNRRKYTAHVIGEIMKDKLDLEEQECDIIVPVPIHESRRRKRGFNQTEEIGKDLAGRTGMKMIPDAVIRTRKTQAMRGLSPTEREANVRGAFSLNEELKDQLAGKRILILDDFFTTGATARAMAEELRKAGPEDLLFLAFAARYDDSFSAGTLDRETVENDRGIIR
ncbi:MAG: ComF family protein [Eubacterium sp.]